MKLTLLGTGAAGGIPLFGCPCPACERARHDPGYRRESACALMAHGDTRLLIDAGLHDLGTRFAPSELDAILLTHYHMDHVQGLFPLRWGRNTRIPVVGPDDPNGCDDLHKHPGILDFSQHAKAFETFEIGAVAITPIPLNHSKPTLGYLFEADGRRIAYLTDTCGLPEESEAFLKLRDLNLLVLDCSFPPRDEVRNHNDLTRALAIHETLGPGRSVLTHATDELDAWLMQHPESLPEDVECGRDGVLLAD